MPQSIKQFAEQLNKSLDDLGAPANIRERANVLSKMFHIPKQQALAYLDGHLFPDADLLKKITSELEIEINHL